MTWLWTTTLGIPGMFCWMMSSRLGLVAEVMATESPSQLSPVVIHSTWAVTSSVALCFSVSAIDMQPPSTDPRQRVANQLVHHPPAAEARLDEDHPRRLGAHLADLRRALAARHGAQRREGLVSSFRRDEG